MLAEAARGSDANACGALVREAARCVGSDGMVGGQVVDLLTRAAETDAEALACRDLKTVALMRLMMTAGALAAGASTGDTRALADFGECFGRAYQLCDDVRDETCSCEATGKPSRQDARHLRASAVVCFGENGARDLAGQLIARGVSRLYDQFGARDEVILLEDAAYLVLDTPRAAHAAVTPVRKNDATHAREKVA